MKRVSVFGVANNFQTLLIQSKEKPYEHQMEKAVKKAQNFVDQKRLGIVKSAAEYFNFDSMYFKNIFLTLLSRLIE